MPHEPLSRFSDRYLDVPRLRCEVGVPLADQPHLGHNRWHPELTSAIEIGAGEEVILEAPGYDDYQIHDNGDNGDIDELAPDARNALLHGLGEQQAANAARTQPPRENGGNMKRARSRSEGYFPVSRSARGAVRRRSLSIDIFDRDVLPRAS